MAHASRFTGGGSIYDHIGRSDITSEEAGDGAEGLTKARAGRFDLIVLDIGLPRMMADDVHPSGQGHRLLGETLGEALLTRVMR